MFDGEVVTKQSKKGTEYTCLVITFPNGYKKTVYLEQAEQFLAQM